MTDLKRLRLEVTNPELDLVLVGDRFEEGGRYVQTVLWRYATAQWDAGHWADLYDQMEQTWERRYGS